MRNKQLFKVLIVLFVFISCKKNDEKFNIGKRNYSGTELKTNGYYYHLSSGPLKVYNFKFLYRNGIILGGASYEEYKVENALQDFANGNYSNSVKNDNTAWGVFQINSNKIEYEFHTPPAPSGISLSSGIILNDTTFEITQNSLQDGSKKISVDEIYHFKKFSPKPDSTNNFIK